MTERLFQNHELTAVSEALDIAEDTTGDFYKFSLGQWKRHRYDVRTLPSLSKDEIIPQGFALLSKGTRVTDGFRSKTREQDFYFICLQDHHILRALRRDKRLGLLSLLIYILTHELVHIVRFCNFLQRYEISGDKRMEEERIVHAATFDILKGISMPELDYVLDSYQGHRICDMAVQ
ncbi:MAG: hypothetical protein V3W43_12245 [Desulfatiglandaceae bacterium]|jgi:hypothetical protein